MHRHNYVAQTRACSNSVFGRLKLTCDTRVIHFDYTLEAALAWTKKKRSIRNEKLKANRVSETEEQRKERMRIRRENDRARRRTKKKKQEGKKKSSETEKHKKQCPYGHSQKIEAR